MDFINPANNQFVDRIKTLEDKLENYTIKTQQQAIQWLDIKEPLQRVSNYYVRMQTGFGSELIEKFFHPGQIVRFRRPSDTLYAYGYVANANTLSTTSDIGVISQIPGGSQDGIPSSWNGDLNFSIAKVPAPVGFSGRILVTPDSAVDSSGGSVTLASADLLFDFANLVGLVALSTFNFTVSGNRTYVDFITNIPYRSGFNNGFEFTQGTSNITVSAGGTNRAFTCKWQLNVATTTYAIRLSPLTGTFTGNCTISEVYHTFYSNPFIVV